MDRRIAIALVIGSVMAFMTLKALFSRDDRRVIFAADSGIGRSGTAEEPALPDGTQDPDR